MTQCVCCFVTAVKGTAGDRIYREREREREREVGAVTTGGNVEGTVTAQHNSSDTVCVLLCYCCEGKIRGRNLLRGRERWVQ